MSLKHFLPPLVAIWLLHPCIATVFGGSPPTTSTTATQSTGKVFNVIGYGAVPDGKTLNTVAIQKAIDDCSQQGGGTVRIPAGTYLSGTLHLRSRMTLSLEAGATLLGSTRIEDYQPNHFLLGEDLDNITLTGPGTIDGQGFTFVTKNEEMPQNWKHTRIYAWVPQHQWRRNKPNPDGLLLLQNCTNVRVTNITLQNSDAWTLHLLACEHAVIDGVIIRNRYNTPNTDGIDLQGSQDVQISNCDIRTGDDAIVLKNRNKKITYPHSCKDIKISHCKLISPTNGFKIGTESYGDFDNIVFRDSVIEAGDPNDPLSTDSLSTISPEHYGNALGAEAGIAVESVDGSHLSHVVVDNIVMHGVRAPIFIRLGDRGKNPTESKTKVPTGSIDDIRISNVTADGASAPSLVMGIPGYPVQNVVISNLRVTNIGDGKSALAPLGLHERESDYPGALMWGAMPAHSLYLRHVDGITIRDVGFSNAKPDSRLAIIADDVSGLKIDGLTLDPVAYSDHLILLNNVRQSQINGTIPRETRTWVSVSGASTTGVTLISSSPLPSGQIFALDAGVSSNAVTVRSQP